VNTISNFVLTLPLKTEKFQEDILDKKFEKCRRIYNSCITELYKRYNHMRESKGYQKNCKYKGKDRNKIFSELNMNYNLTEYSLHNFVKSMGKYYNIDAMTVQKIATRAFNAFLGLMLHKTKKIKYKSYGELNSIEGKTNKQGIRFRDNVVLFSGLKIPAIIDKNDIYAHQALLNKIKYCRIKREIIKREYHYYIQLILEGIPPLKLNKKTGEVKHYINNGVVGLDIGTQSLGICCKDEVKLLELAPEVQNIEKQKRKIQRKMDRSRRTNNPNKYNENGTINTKYKSKWIKSKNYIKIQNELKEIQRKQREIKKQSHNKLANYILTLGNDIKVETMNYKGLQARTKKTTINKKTGKFNKKKRFGKSLANKAPSMFLTILGNKLKWEGKELKKIDTWKVKASQYNHIEDLFVKKNLSKRWNDFGEFKIQRDLYSSFLIMNVEDNLSSINRDLCIETFDNFKKLHDIEIERLKNSELSTALRNVI
jgi:hypothetical protein